MEKGFSPGPWFATLEMLAGQPWYLIRDKHGEIVAGIRYGEGMSLEQTKANAQAIGALPALVAACEVTLAALKASDVDMNVVREAVQGALICALQVDPDLPDLPSGPTTSAA